VYRCVAADDWVWNPGRDDDCGGLGDRLWGITSVFVGAIAHGRAYFIDSPSLASALEPAVVPMPPPLRNGQRGVQPGPAGQQAVGQQVRPISARISVPRPPIPGPFACLGAPKFPSSTWSKWRRHCTAGCTLLPVPSQILGCPPPVLTPCHAHVQPAGPLMVNWTVDSSTLSTIYMSDYSMLRALGRPDMLVTDTGARAQVVAGNAGVFNLLYSDLHNREGPLRAARAMLLEANLSRTDAPFCIMHHLFQPTAAAKRRVASLAARILSPTESCIGIHVRNGDFQLNPKASGDVTIDPTAQPWATAVALTAQLEAAGHRVSWYLLSDTHMLKVAAARRFPQYVFYSSEEPWHINKKERVLYMSKYQHGAPSEASMVQGTVAEWWLLTLCKYILLGESGYSRTAAIYSGLDTIIVPSLLHKRNSTGLAMSAMMDVPEMRHYF
jgi:hypothetical protein